MLILAVIGAVGFFLGALLWVEQAPSPSRFVAPYSGTELVDAVMAMGLLAFLFHGYRARSMSFYHRLQESKERLRAMASTDVLTGLLNARAYYERCDQFLLATRRKRSPFAVLFIDLDHFKAINDSYGHPAGDRVLLGLSRLLQQRLRSTDIVGRYGGEEFAIALHSTGKAQAQHLLNGLREDFSRLVFYSGEHEFRCSFSAGIATYPQYQRLETLRQAADDALYRAKHQGRNCVVVV